MKESLFAGLLVAALIALGAVIGYTISPPMAILLYIAARIDMKLDSMREDIGMAAMLGIIRRRR